MSCNYFGHLFSEAAIRRLLDQLMKVLRELPGCRSTGEITLLSAEEVEQVMAWNATAVEYPRDRCIHEQIEEQAEKTPEAVAVVYGEQRLSYRELNEKAERLARYLAEAGVGVESRVGIYLRRSVELMIGVLGALKAGATYVPLEPGLPKARLEYMIKDAEIEWALVESSGIESLPLGGVDLALMDGAGTDPKWLEEIGDRGIARGGEAEAEGGEPGLHPLYLGIDREAQGGDGDAPRLVELCGARSGRVSWRRDRRIGGEFAAEFRCDVDDLVAAAGGGQDGGVAAGR